MTSRRITAIVLICLFAIAAPGSAELKLPAIIGANMVLQAGPCRSGTA